MSKDTRAMCAGIAQKVILGEYSDAKEVFEELSIGYGVTLKEPEMCAAPMVKHLVALSTSENIEDEASKEAFASIAKEFDFDVEWPDEVPNEEDAIDAITGTSQN